MPSLRETQSAFLAAIRSNASSPDATWVVEDGIAAGDRVQIYRNNYRLGALAAMQATYPVVERLGGADWFRQTVARYQQQYPSTCGDLQFIGEAFPGFLRADLETSAYDYFSDVATLEWTYQLVLTAPDREAAEIAVLEAVDPAEYERLLFIPRPAVSLVESKYPIFAIWHAHQPEVTDPGEIRLDAGPSRVLLIRRPDHVELRELAEPTFLLLAQFLAGATFVDAAEFVAGRVDEFDLQHSLREVLGLRAIAEITVGER